MGGWLDAGVWWLVVALGAGFLIGLSHLLYVAHPKAKWKSTTIAATPGHFPSQERNRNVRVHLVPWDSGLRWSRRRRRAWGPCLLGRPQGSAGWRGRPRALWRAGAWRPCGPRCVVRSVCRGGGGESAGTVLLVSAGAGRSKRGERALGARNAPHASSLEHADKASRCARNQPTFSRRRPCRRGPGSRPGPARAPPAPGPPAPRCASCRAPGPLPPPPASGRPRRWRP